MDSTQRVNRAVAIAVSHALTASGAVDNPRAFEVAVGKRIQGTYGAQLRRLADSDATLTPDDLYAAVIAPDEKLPKTTSVMQGFKQSPGPFLDASVPSGGVPEFVRDALAEGKAKFNER
jgi:hypothetical protein